MARRPLERPRPPERRQPPPPPPPPRPSPRPPERHEPPKPEQRHEPPRPRPEHKPPARPKPRLEHRPKPEHKPRPSHKPPARHKPPGRPKPSPAHAAAGGDLGTFEATAYGPPWGGIQGSGRTATGIDLRADPQQYIVAVDPSVIALHTWVTVDPNPFGDPTIQFHAEDTGGAIKGRRIDIYDWRGRASQLQWGRRPVTVTAISRGVGTPVTPEQGAKPIYVNPLKDAHVAAERIDQGVDYRGSGFLVAIADADISAVTPGGWGRFGNYLEYKIVQSGQFDGAYVFYAEGVRPLVNYGQHVQAGERIAELIAGWPYGIEIGFAAGDGHDHTYFAYHDGSYAPYDSENAATRPGIAFSNLIVRLGGPGGRIEGPIIGKWPEYVPEGQLSGTVLPAPGPGNEVFLGLSPQGAAGLAAQYDWGASVKHKWQALHNGVLAGSHHSHAALDYVRGVTYLTKAD